MCVFFVHKAIDFNLLFHLVAFSNYNEVQTSLGFSEGQFAKPNWSSSTPRLPDINTEPA